MRRAFLLADLHHEVERLARCLRGSVSHKSAAARVGFNQTFFAQRLDCFANGRTTDPESLCEITLGGKLVARFQRAVEDGFFDLLDDLLVQPRGSNNFVHRVFSRTGQFGGSVAGLATIPQVQCGRCGFCGIGSKSEQSPVSRYGGMTTRTISLLLRGMQVLSGLDFTPQIWREMLLAQANFTNQAPPGAKARGERKICLTSFPQQWYGCRTNKRRDVMTFRSTAMSAGHETTAATRIVLLALVLSLISLPALAQSTAGRVLGRVT